VPVGGPPGTTRDNFTSTGFLLLDEYTDAILARADVEPGILGSRFAMLVFMEGAGPAASDKEIGSAAGLFGPTERKLIDSWVREPAQEARADFDYAMATLRACAVAGMMTDDQASGQLSGVPAGTNYLYGRFRHQGLRRAIWNLRLALPAGPSRASIGIDNAVRLGTKRE